MKWYQSAWEIVKFIVLGTIGLAAFAWICCGIYELTKDWH